MVEPKMINQGCSAFLEAVRRRSRFEPAGQGESPRERDPVHVLGIHRRGRSLALPIESSLERPRGASCLLPGLAVGDAPGECVEGNQAGLGRPDGRGEVQSAGDFAAVGEV